MTSLSDRISTLEQKYPDEADDYSVQCILSRMTDADLNILERAAKYRERNHTMEEVEKYLNDLGKLEEYWKALEHGRQIHAELIERAKRDDLPGIMIAGREVALK